MTRAQLLAAPQFSLRQSQKEDILVAHLNTLTRLHRQRCAPYRKITDLLFPRYEAEILADVPYLPVGIFKSEILSSIPETEIFRILTSSGTTGQRVSQIILDKAAAQLQTVALSRVMTHILGPQRLPMLIIDSPSVLKNKTQPSARSAAILGMMNFGRHHVFALDEHFQLNQEALSRFFADFSRAPFFVFGFTFLLWSSFYQPLQHSGLNLAEAILVHGGGWKKMQDFAVDNAEFKHAFHSCLAIRRIYNFYGMAEQIGSIFLEGESDNNQQTALLYAPNFADVIIRDPVTWKPTPVGAPGLIQVLSLLPESYPGHSILTEDMGIIERVDSGPRYGKAFRVLGRMQQAELRGCSDTHASEYAA